MRRSRAVRAALLVALAACSSASSDPKPQAAPAAPPGEGAAAGPAEDAAAEPVVDEDADAILRRVGETLAAAQRFSFRIEATKDDFLSSGQGIEMSTEARVFMRRPGFLRVESLSDRGKRVTQFDGTNFGMTDLTRNVYVQGASPTPLSVEGLLDLLAEEYGVHVPLADLLTDDPHMAIADGLEHATHVGLHLVRGVRCDHIAGTTSGVDWQVWVPAEGPALPAKVTLESSGEDGSERFSAHITDWDLADASPDEAFAFAPPEGARRIKMARRKTTETSETAGGDR